MHRTLQAKGVVLISQTKWTSAMDGRTARTRGFTIRGDPCSDVCVSSVNLKAPHDVADGDALYPQLMLDGAWVMPYVRV